MQLVRRNRVIFAVLFIIICSFATGCNEKSEGDSSYLSNDTTTIQKLAYNRSRGSMYRIGIEENGELVPYLVLTDDYNGDCLLLREYLLEEEACYSPEKSQGTNGGYYPNSNIDNYLDTVYFSMLSPDVQRKLIDKSISVSTLEGVSAGGSVRTTESIQRKTFLLSATELNIKSGMASIEGKPLSYFKKGENLVATTKDGDAKAYWLRSAYHWDDIQAWAIGADGGYGGNSVSVNLAVRPAFCLDCNEKVIKSDNTLNAEEIYILIPQK